MGGMSTNAARQVADIILDGVAAYWSVTADQGSFALLEHIPLTGTIGEDGTLTVNTTALSLGGTLAAVALTQREISIGDTQQSHLAAARQYLDRLAPYDADTA